MPPRPRITRQKAASAAMPPPPPQSAARLPSLAPHEVGRGCNMNRHAEDSWRSHVHRTYTAQRVQSFKIGTANAGGRGGTPLAFLWGIKRGYSLRKENTPFVSCSASRRCLPRPVRGNQKGIPSSEREYPLCLAVALSAALSMQRNALRSLPFWGTKKEPSIGRLSFLLD